MKNLLKHPRNKHIIFDKEKHEYYYKGEKFDGVTGWIASYGKPFNKKKVSKKVAAMRGMSEDDVIAEWDEARDYGNEVHDIFEDWINLGQESDRIELKILKSALKELKLKPIYGEFVIYDEDIMRASPIDILCVNEDETKYVIVDTKTMKKDIKAKSYKDAMMIYPLNHLPDSKFYKHSLQVSVYRKWLKEKYKVPVDDNAYVLQVNGDQYDIITCLALDHEIELMYGDQ